MVVDDRESRKIKQPEIPATTKSPPPITIVGVGGAGVSVLRRLAKKATPGIRYVACDADARSLDSCPPAVTAVEMGRYVPHNWPDGEFDPAIGRQAAEESLFKLELKEEVKNAEMVILTAGMGGVIGSGATPVVAGTIKETGAFLLALVTAPFHFEGGKRRRQAGEAVQRLAAQVDNMIVIYNDRLLWRVCREVGGMLKTQAFPIVDEVMERGILDVVEPLSVPETINTDLDGVKKVMCLSGGTVLALGKGSHLEGTVMEAAKDALNNLLDNPYDNEDLSQAKGILLRFRGGPNIGLGEYLEAMAFICGNVQPDSAAVLGVSLDRVQGSTVDLTLIATGIEPRIRSCWTKTKW